MHDTLQFLYQRCYTPLPMEDAERELEDCQQQLMALLGKQDQKLALRLIDAMAWMQAERSFDSFVCGFRLAMELSAELEQYMNDRPEAGE